MYQLWESLHHSNISSQCLDSREKPSLKSRNPLLLDWPVGQTQRMEGIPHLSYLRVPSETAWTQRPSRNCHGDLWVVSSPPCLQTQELQ